mgnify:CR=1 FL=1
MSNRTQPGAAAPRLLALALLLATAASASVTAGGTAGWPSDLASFLLCASNQPLQGVRDDASGLAADPAGGWWLVRARRDGVGWGTAGAGAAIGACRTGSTAWTATQCFARLLCVHAHPSGLAQLRTHPCIQQTPNRPAHTHPHHARMRIVVHSPDPPGSALGLV